MGGFPSLPIKSLKAVAASPNKYCPECSMVDNFILWYMQNMPVQVALTGILDNCFSAVSYMNFIDDNWDKVRGITGMENDSVFDPLELRKELLERNRSPPINPPSKILSVIFEMLPLFLNSEYFKKWRQSEQKELLHLSTQLTAGPTEVTLPELPSGRYAEDIGKISEASAQYRGSLSDRVSCNALLLDTPMLRAMGMTKAMPLPNALECDPDFNPVLRAMSSCHPSDMAQLIQHNSWLPLFISAVEMLSICVTISQCNISTNTFPVIYVNPSFSKMAARKREDIIGRPGAFLQTRNTLHLPHQQAIVYSLIQMATKPNFSSIVDITCSRFTGEVFQNVLGMQSLSLNNNNNKVPPTAKYIITLQHELSEEESVGDWKNIFRDLLQSLPYTL